MLDRTPAAVDDFWTKQLGALAAKGISESRLVILVARPWAPGEYAASDTVNLPRRLKTLLSLSFFGRVPRIESGFFCYGHGEKLERFEETPRYVASKRVYFPALRLADLQFAVRHAGSLALLMRSSDDFYRVRQGLASFDSMMKAENAADRLHLAVRSLDGLVATKQGRGRKDFVGRAQYFVTPPDRPILETLYRLRDHVEHLKDPVDYVKGQFPELLDPVREAFRLSFAAELIANYAWRRFLDRGDVHPSFAVEQTIEDFWARPAATLQETWGEPPSLKAELGARFHGEPAELHDLRP